MRKYTILRRWVLWALFIGLVGVAAGFVPAILKTKKIEVSPRISQKAADEAARWGIRILHLRLVAEGYLLDLRFQVIDQEKAVPIMSREHSAYLVDQRTGKVLPVPITKSGAMRQTTRKPENGREYFMFFSNPRGMVKPDDLMTLAVGEIRIKDIPVEKALEPMDAKGQEAFQRKKIKAWQEVRKKLRREFEECRLACKEDSACLDRCGERLAEQEKSEYMRIVYGKEESRVSP